MTSCATTVTLSWMITPCFSFRKYTKTERHSLPELPESTRRSILSSAYFTIGLQISFRCKTLTLFTLPLKSSWIPVFHFNYADVPDTGWTLLSLTKNFIYGARGKKLNSVHLHPKASPEIIVLIPRQCLCEGHHRANMETSRSLDAMDALISDRNGHAEMMFVHVQFLSPRQVAELQVSTRTGYVK